MAPVSRCDLRLPNTPKPSSKRPKSGTPAEETTRAPSSAKSKQSDPDVGARGKGTSSAAKLSDPDVGARGKGTASAAKLSDPGSASSTGLKDKRNSDAIDDVRSKSQQFADDLGIELHQKEDAENENVPEPAHGEHPRDWGEVLEEDSEFRTSVTRDSYEAEQHAGHDIDGGGGGSGGLDACEILRQCKAEVEEATAAGECEQMACPRLDQIGTPGDVCAQFCHDRMDSPRSVAELEMASSSSHSKYCAKWSKKGRVSCDMRLGRRKDGKAERAQVVCKGTYKTDETYVSLWGSSKAMDYRKRIESQMKKKRNLLEKMHLKDFLRRQKMRQRAKEKRRALKQRDPNKISNGDDNLRINKAYGLRVHYNKQLPMMPITMQQHFDKFKKPPFKTYVTGKRACTKRVDEFEKLLVPEKNKK